MENNENLMGVVKTLYKFRRLIIRACMAVFIGSIIISLLLPVYYKSTTTFYAASTDFVNPDKMFGGGATDFRYYGAGDDIERLLTIAVSGGLIEHMVKEFNLYEHYDIDSTSVKAPFYVAEKFNGLYNVQKTKYDALMLSVEDEDPVMSARMANAARKKIESISLALAKKGQAQQINSMLSSIDKQENELRIIADSLKKLREQYSIYDIESQGETISSLFSTATAAYSKLEGKYEALKNSPSTPRDSVKKVEIELLASQNQIANLKKDIDLFNQGRSTVEVLSEQHEAARKQLSWNKEWEKKIQAANESDATIIHLVESAQIPISKARPVRSIIVLASTVLAFFLTVLGILIFDQYQNVDWSSVLKGEK